jgi:hypothetical protein
MSIRPGIHVISGFFLVLMIAVSGCRISSSKDSSGHDKDQVDIRTPLGSISVHTGESDPKATGLALYPGAQIKKDSDGDSGANVNVSSSLFGVKVVALKYRSDDAPDKVLGFYKKDMAKYGKVLDCTGSITFSYHRHDQDSEVTCDNHGSGHEYNEELKVGTDNNQRVVAIRPYGSGSEFALIYVRAWDDKTSM